MTDLTAIQLDETLNKLIEELAALKEALKAKDDQAEREAASVGSRKYITKRIETPEGNLSFKG